MDRTWDLERREAFEADRREEQRLEAADMKAERFRGSEEDDTESIRRAMMGKLASAVVSEDEAAERKRLEAQYGQVWDTDQLRVEFEVKGFMAPLVVAVRIGTGETGSLLFQAWPRFYFSWTVDQVASKR